jgi:hypothetical protein
MIFYLPKFGRHRRRLFFLCQSSADIAADYFFFAKVRQASPQMIFHLPKFGRHRRRLFFIYQSSASVAADDFLFAKVRQASL